MPIELTALGGTWTRVIQTGSEIVCVEVGPNMHSGKRADQLVTGDKICSCGLKSPGPGGLEIETATEV